MKRFIWLLIVGVALVGCSMTTGPTGDTSNQTTSAQSFLPTLNGYTVTNADSLTDAITAVSGGASLITGNPALAAAIAKIDQMMQCYQDVGAVASQVYTQVDLGAVLQGQIPRVGAVAVINEDRLSRNFLNCALGGQGFSSQAAALEPCIGSGSFTVEGEKIDYVYAGTHADVCTAFQNHFNTYGTR